MRDLIAINDGGRSTSRRPKQKNDCTVRALAISEGLDYDLAYDELKEAGRQCAKGFDFKAWAKAQPKRFESLSFPAVKGRPRMNVERFCHEYPSGTYIIRTAKHVMAVKGGVVYDDCAPDMLRCVYAAYRILKD